jgi:hypothetical protein
MPTLAARKAFWGVWPTPAPDPPIVPGAIVWIWDHWNKRWEFGIGVEDLGGNYANVAMVSGTFRRNMYNVQKWPGSGPLDLTPDDTPSAWLEGTEPEPTDPVE